MTELAADQDAPRFVAARYGARATAPTLLGAGAWSRAYAFRLDGRDVVIRFGAHGEDFAKDARMGDIGLRDLAVPRVVELGETGSGYFVVSDRARGEFLDELDGVAMRAVLPRLLAALDAIRGIDVSQSRGFGAWSSDGTAPFDSWGQALLAINEVRPRIGDWRAELARSSVGGESFELAYAELRELAGDLPNARQMIHGDLLAKNVLVRGPRITAVLDWGNAMYGDALFDAAWLIYWWPWYPKWGAIDIDTALREHWQQQGTSLSDVDNRLLAYQLFIGLDHLAYTASRHRWAELAWNDRRIRQLLT